MQRLSKIGSLFGLLLMLMGLPAQAQDSPDYFIEAAVSQMTPYIGQQITYTFRLYDAIGLRNPQYSPPDFEGFWRVDLGDVTQGVQQINGRQYTVSEIRTALYPTQIGEVVISPGNLTLPETVFRSKETLQSNEVVIQVQTLPDGAPAGFSGGVGQFQMGATLDRQTAKLGEPITLKLTVSGTGNVEQLDTPLLELPQGWQHFENPATYSAAQQNGIIVGTKVYEILIFPAQAGTQILPEATLIYFDPESLSYRSMNTTPISLDVLTTEEQSVSPTTEAVGNVPSLKPVLALAPSGTIGLWLLWLVPPIVVAGSWGWRRWKTAQRRQQILSRQSKALQTALGQLQGVSQQSPEMAYRSVLQIIQAYVTDKSGDKVGEDVIGDLPVLLEKKGVGVNVIKPLILCIDAAMAGLYAPAGNINPAAVAKRTAEALKVVDTSWQT